MKQKKSTVKGVFSMIIDSKQYDKPCVCGRSHAMTTAFCVIEPGCLARLGEYLTRFAILGKGVAIYDENTYRAKGMVRPQVAQEIILPPENLHADNHGVALAMEQIPEGCDYLIALGSGTIHDITRYCAHEKGIPFVSCPTAASVDGFCSSVAAMTWYGFKKTWTAVAPTLVVADLNVITQAPAYLSRSGFGDMVGKFVALTEWKIGHTLTGEYLCPEIYRMTLEATQAVVDSADGILAGETEAYEKLMYGLLLSGLAMQLLGNSRCASGAEHHISHFIEMAPPSLGQTSQALHGEKVGVGTLLVSREYHRLAREEQLPWKDYPVATPAEIGAVFGPALEESIVTENQKDCAAGLKAEQLQAAWPAIRQLIAQIPTPQALEAMYEKLGVKTTLADIGITEEALPLLLDDSPLVRNRLTLMRLRRALAK